MKMNWFILICICWSSIAFGADLSDVQRRDYMLPIDDHRIDTTKFVNKGFMNAVISARVLEINKRCSDITASDPEYLQFMQPVMKAVLSLDEQQIASILYSGNDIELIKGISEFHRPIFAGRKLEDIQIDFIVFLEDNYLIMASIPEAKGTTLSCLIRKEKDGKYGVDFSEKNEYTKVTPWLRGVLRRKSGYNPKLCLHGSLTLDTETVLTPIEGHPNSVLVKYDSVDLFNGLSRHVRKKEAGRVLSFLQNFWQAEDYGTVEDVSTFYTESGALKLKGFYEKMGESYFMSWQSILRQKNQHLIYLIFADPLIYAYYNNGDEVTLICNEGGNLEIPAYGVNKTSMVQLFQEVVSIEKSKRKGRVTAH